MLVCSSIYFSNTKLEIKSAKMVEILSSFITEKDIVMIHNIKSAQKKYRSANKKKIYTRNENYIKKLKEETPELYSDMRKKYNSKYYKKKKDNGISKEEKEAKAKYMREYRARKKLEAQISEN